VKKLLFVILAWVLSAAAALAAVNVNTATKEQLDALKGIGPTKAQAIIDYRTKNGPFKSIDDLEKVPGIGPATLKEIRNDVTLTGATTGIAAPAKDAAPVTKAKDDKAAAKKDDVKAISKADEKKAAAKAEDKKATAKAEEKKATVKDEVKATKKDAGKEAKKDDAKSSKDDAKAVKDEKKTDKK